MQNNSAWLNRLHYNQNNQIGLSPNRKAFTLAEVLITLGIIGIVAAITIPALISSYNKSVVETRLKGFYSNINQAILMSEKDNGDKGTWDTIATPTSTDVRIWYNQYLAPYLKTTDIKDSNSGNSIICYFPDGSLLSIGKLSWIFFPKASDYDPNISYKILNGKTNFTFGFWPSDTSQYHYNKGVEPYKMGWNGTENMLRTNSDIGCQQTVTNERAYCTP